MVEEHHQSKCAVAEQTHVQSVRASKPSRPVSLGLRKKRFTPPASGTSAWRSPAGMADTCTSRYASLLNTHTWNRFEQASLIVECHSDCALDNSFFRVIHADPSAHPRRNGRLVTGRHEATPSRSLLPASALCALEEAQRPCQRIRSCFRSPTPPIRSSGPTFFQVATSCPETAMSGMDCCERRPLAPLLNTHAWNRVW